MAPMNEGLQKHMIREAIEREGLDPCAYDVESIVDPTLSLPENFKNFRRHTGVTIRKDS